MRKQFSPDDCPNCLVPNNIHGKIRDTDGGVIWVCLGETRELKPGQTWINDVKDINAQA